MPHPPDTRIDKGAEIVYFPGNVLPHPASQNRYSFKESQWQYRERVQPGIEACYRPEPEYLFQDWRQEQEVQKTLELDLGRLIREIVTSGSVYVECRRPI